MSGWSRPLPPQSVNPGSTGFTNSATAPAASAVLADAGILPAGLYYVETYTQFTGTVAAGDTAFAMVLALGATVLTPLMTTAVAGGSVIPQRWQVRVNGTSHLTISVASGITSGGSCVYSSMLVVYPISVD